MSPDRLGLDESGTLVVFRVENQGCAAWGVSAADLASADPPVYLQDRSPDGGWEPFLDRVSVACVEMVLSEALLGGRQMDMCEPPGELIPVVGSAFRQMPVPEYRLWAGRSLTVRWFSAPGKLLRMDGRGPYCWLTAGGQTQDDLESIRAIIPGPWTSAQ